MAIASIVFDPLDGSEALSAAAVADSKGVSAGDLASEAKSIAQTGDSAAIAAADSKAVSAGVAASTADSKAVIADSKAVVADSKGVSAGVAASTADSKAVIADSKAVSVGVVADSAIGSEPDAGEYKITDMKRNAAGSIVVEYDDSAIGS